MGFQGHSCSPAIATFGSPFTYAITVCFLANRAGSGLLCPHPSACLQALASLFSLVFQVLIRHNAIQNLFIFLSARFQQGG